MGNIIRYITVILVWGATWYAIKLQVSLAPGIISILYRTTLATVLLVVWCKIKGLSLRFSLKSHLFLFLLGVSMFSVHYLFIYGAAKYIVSGVIAVIFSCTSFLNIFNNFLFFQKKPTPGIIFGTLVGVIGLCLFFWHEVSIIDLQGNSLIGFMLAGMSAFVFSLSGSISKRNNNRNFSILPSMAVGMVYGVLIIIIYTLIHSQNLVFPDNPIYWGALLYLAVPGSIIGSLCYLQLIKNIGPEIAGYTTILYPVVALLISWKFENYQWSLMNLLGLFFIILGNIVLLRRKTFSIIRHQKKKNAGAKTKRI